jgi:hypothetical protein
MSPTTELIRRQLPSLLRKGMYDDARLAGMIVLAEPERIGDEAVGDFLMRTIVEIDRDTVAGWLAVAAINPWRRGRNLTGDQRDRLGRELIAFWKAGQS